MFKDSFRFLTHVTEERARLVPEAAKAAGVVVRVSKRRLTSHDHPDPPEGWTSLYSAVLNLTAFWNELDRLNTDGG